MQLPTGDRLQIPTGAETLRLKGYLILCRNTRSDFAEFADLVDVDGHLRPPPWCSPGWTGITVQSDLSNNGLRPSWCAGWPIPTRPTSMTTIAGPVRTRSRRMGEVRQRCLSVAVAILEEAR